MILAEQIANYLFYLDMGIYSPNDNDGNIYIDLLPDGEQLICLINRSGFQSDSKLGYTSAGIQLIYRGNKNPIDSFQVASDLHFSLHGFHDDVFCVGGNHIVSCFCQQGSPTFIGDTAQQKFEYSINLVIDYKI
mgnify:CR=1